METLIIESKTPFSMDLIKATLLKELPVEDGACENTLVIPAKRGNVYVLPDPEEGAGTRLLVDYSNVELAKRVVEIIANDPAYIIDNDFGTVLPGNEFVARYKFKKKWDWLS